MPKETDEVKVENKGDGNFCKTHEYNKIGADIIFTILRTLAKIILKR